MNEKPATVAVLTEDEMRSFATVQDELRALDETVNSIVSAAVKNHTVSRNLILTKHRTSWEAVEKKYGLDPRKSYELIHSTRELVEHQCAFGHGGAVVINLGAALTGAETSIGAIPPKKDLN